MITEDLINRINYLARKKRYEGLTEEEALEQKEVREIYLKGIREQVRNSLEALKEAQNNHGSEDLHQECKCGCCQKDS